MKIDDFKKIAKTREDGHDFFAPFYKRELEATDDELGLFIRSGLDSISEPYRGSKPTGRQLSAAKVYKRFRDDEEYRAEVIAWAKKDIDETIAQITSG